MESRIGGDGLPRIAGLIFRMGPGGNERVQIFSGEFSAPPPAGEVGLGMTGPRLERGVMIPGVERLAEIAEATGNEAYQVLVFPKKAGAEDRLVEEIVHVLKRLKVRELELVGGGGWWKLCVRKDDGHSSTVGICSFCHPALVRLAISFCSAFPESASTPNIVPMKR